MKKLTNTIKRIGIIAGVAVTSAFTFVSDVFASGGGSGYGGHIPRETGLIEDKSTLIFVAAAIALYLIGFAVLVSTEALKKRVKAAL